MKPKAITIAKKASCGPKKGKEQKLKALRAIQRNVVNGREFKVAHKNEYIIHLFSLGTCAADVSAACCGKIGRSKLETVIANP